MHEINVLGRPATTATDPPANLAEPGMSLWNDVASKYDVSDPGGRELLLQACMACNRAAEMRKVIDAEGLTISTKSGPREHPLLKHELNCQAFVARVLNRLLASPKRPVGRPTDQSMGPLGVVRAVKS
jgi:hypothetical protein